MKPLVLMPTMSAHLVPDDALLALLSYPGSDVRDAAEAELLRRGYVEQSIAAALGGEL